MERSGVRPVKILEIVNPFTQEMRTGEVLLAPKPGEFLDACLQRAGLNASDYALRLNDEFIREGEEAFHMVKPGDSIACCRAAGDGALKIISMVAILAVTTALTGGFGDVVEAMLWTGLGITTATTAAIAAAAIAIGGNMLVSAFLGGGGTGNTLQAGVTYDPTGPKTLAQPGTPIPKGYGTMGWGGNIISSFVDMDGKDEYLNILVSFGFGPATNMAGITLNGKPVGEFPDLTHYMRYGTNTQTPIAGFDTIENVYSQEIDLLEANGPTIVTGTGTNTSGLQIVIKFPGGLMRTDSSGNPKEVSFAYKVEVSPSGQNQWTTPIFPKDTSDVYTVDNNGFRHYPYWVVMPTDRYAGSGLVYSTDTDEGAHYPGEPWNETLGVKVYAPDNTNTTYNAPFSGEWQPTTDSNLDLMSVTDWWGGYRIVSNMTDQSFYDVVNVYGLAVGKWDVRVTKWGAGPHNQPIPQGDGYMTDPHYTADGWLWDVAELQFTDLAYPNSILLGIRALATSQLSGANITVLAEVTHDIGADTVLPAALAGFEHDNPAIVAYDIIMNPLYGMAGSNPAIGVDIPAFVNWANFCDEQVPTAAGGTQRRFTFAGVFDQGGSNAWSCLQKVATMSRAQVLQDGNNFTVWIDAPTDITQVFTDANIKRGSYSETFVALDSRATQVEVEFADATRNWRTDLPVSVMTATTINGTLQPKLTRVNLNPGCTNRDQAWQWAYFNLLSTETLMRTAKWNCAIESVSCRRGSVVGMQQRMWSYGGRIQAGSTTANLIIDRTDLPAFSSNPSWTVGVQHPVFTVGTATIQSVTAAGNGTYLVTFTGNLPAGRILHMAGPSAGIEAEVLSVSQSGGANSNSLTMGTVQGAFIAGQAVTLYDYDRIELQTVSSLNGLSIVPASAFSQVPTPDAPWFYAQSGVGAPYKTFRVTSVKQSGDFEMEISGLEYNPEIYTDVTPNYGAIVSFPSVNAGVSNLTLLEKFGSFTTDANRLGTQALITVNWDNGPNTVTVDIFGQVDGGAWNQLATAVGKAGYSFAATTGDVWSIIVVGRDQFGVTSSYNAAPMQTITVQGTGAAPGPVVALSGTLQSGTLVLTWSPPSGMPAAATYEIRYNPDASDNNWNDGQQVASGLTSPTYTITGVAGSSGVPVPIPGGQNYVVWSQLMSSSPWSRAALASVVDSQPAPDDGLSADLITALSGSSDSYLSQQLPPLNGSGLTVTFSVYLRCASGTQAIDIQILDTAGQTVQSCNLTTGWQRFSVTRANLAGLVSVFIGGNGTLTNGQTVYAAWAQAETGSIANPYQETQGTIVPAETSGNGLYMVKAMSAGLVESVTPASWALTTNTSSLNGIGSVPPGEAFVVNVDSNTYSSTSGTCTLELECPAQTLARPDGTTFAIPDSTLTWTNLAPATTYYIYTYVRLTDGTLHSAAGDPPTLPDATPNPTHALQAAADGLLAGPIITITTPSTSGTGGGSSGGGPGVCPDAEELVETHRGIIRAGDVEAGDSIKGYCFETGKDVFRTVQAIRQLRAWSWYRVNGYRMSPIDPVWVDGEWKAPYTIGIFDGGIGVRAQIMVAADTYDQRNFYLVGREERLLIHNMRIPPC